MIMLMLAVSWCMHIFQLMDSAGDGYNRYKESEKAETRELMDYLTNTKYDGVSGVRAHILKMEDIANRLTKLKVPIAEPFLVYQILNSLPQKEWDHLKTAYHTQNDTWTVNALISLCVGVENKKGKKTKDEVVNLVTNPPFSKGKSGKPFYKSSKGNKFQKNKSNPYHKPGPYQKHGPSHNPKGPEDESNKEHDTNTTGVTCWFCNQTGHRKSECSKYKAWLAEKKTGVPKQTNTK
ncbi:uncharacterized protein LOC141599328 [Silene latifolia]|uniref:uncharacterized protein LOC141599328 n=1 Tax=Silene latifolia TaxID=37657 RepID=UPI003D77D8E4